jgi:cytochrome bd-type quinol oxidase subunit 1
MFSKGQIIFAVVFFVAFIIGISLAYRTDKGANKTMFKGSYKVLIFSLFIFFALYGLVKLKHYIAP